MKVSKICSCMFMTDSPPFMTYPFDRKCESLEIPLIYERFLYTPLRRGPSLDSVTYLFYNLAIFSLQGKMRFTILCCQFTILSHFLVLYSTCTLLIFLDVASAKMNVRLDRQWNNDLKNTSSDVYKNLEKQLVDDIVKILPDENGVKPLVRILGFK